MEKKIKVSFVYRGPCYTLSPQSYYTQSRNLFFNALRRNSAIKVNYILSEKKFDSDKIKGKSDVLLIYENFNTGSDCVPDELIGIKKLNIPVISKIGDPWAAKNFDVKKYHEKYNIAAYFGPWAKDFFYKYYPSNFKYKEILFGIEPSFYKNITPYNERIKNKILNSGAIVNTRFTNRLFQKLVRREADPMKHYKLRTLCNNLPYVNYSTTMGHEYVGDKYHLLLNKYSAAIAATTDTFTMKYFEMPAAGCTTFMEITDKNYGHILGYKDGKSAIFINEQNYKEKFEEYLYDINNPKWQDIANAGRKHALENFNNDKAVKSLIELFKELL